MRLQNLANGKHPTAKGEKKEQEPAKKSGRAGGARELNNFLGTLR